MSAGRPTGLKLLPAILAAPAGAVPEAPSPLRASASLLVAPASPGPWTSPLSLRLRLLHACFLERDLLLGLRPLLTLTAARLSSWRWLGSLLLC